MTTSLLGKTVRTSSLGLMGMTWRPEPQPAEKSIAAMRAALDVGVNFWNGGTIYGPPDANSLQLLHKYFTQYPEDAEKVVLSIKGAMNPEKGEIDNSAEGVRKAVDNCLEVLDGKKTLDLFECARVDPKVRIEETVEALAEYVKAGKLGGIALSEIGPKAIRRAAKVHKIAAVEVEFSLFFTEIWDNGVAAACAENDIPIVAYSVLGKGLLSGGVKKPEDLPAHIQTFPRYQGENFYKNMEIVHEVEKVAKSKGCTLSQVAIAWAKAQAGRHGMPNTVFALFGATSSERVKENATDVELSQAEIQELDDIMAKNQVQGDRYAKGLSAMNFGEGAD